MQERIRRVFEDVFKGAIAFNSELSRETESKWDSMKHIEFLVALEREFNLRFDGSDATEMNSIGRIISIIEQRM
ncbi:MAG: acyl carrier protein [Nitrospirae bacterium]|nr:acyl carrier protein [Nitrospirota bacterium]